MTTPLFSAVGVTAEERTAIQRTQAKFQELVGLSNPRLLHQELRRIGRGDWDFPEELNRTHQEAQDAIARVTAECAHEISAILSRALVSDCLRKGRPTGKQGARRLS